MDKNIIIGNGINIQYDECNDWREFVHDCQKEFENKIINLNKKNIFLKNLYLIWKRVYKDNDIAMKFNGLEDYLDRFNVFFYRFRVELDKGKYLVVKNIEHLKEIKNTIKLGKTIRKITKKNKPLSNSQEQNILVSIFKYSVLPFLDFKHSTKRTKKIIKNLEKTLDKDKKNLLIDYFLHTLRLVYKRTFKEVLLNKYNINKIDIPQKTIRYINDFDKKITLNYDNNLISVENLYRLHGQFDIHLDEKKYLRETKFKKNQDEIVFKQNNLSEKHIFNLKVFLNWQAKNMLDLRRNPILFYSDSLKKEKTLEWQKAGVINQVIGIEEIWNLIKGGKNRLKYSTSNKQKNVLTYNSFLSKLEGEVVLIGINEKGDEEIFTYLILNKKIEKIVMYVDNNKISKCEKSKENVTNSTRIHCLDYKLFWCNVQKWNG